MYSNISRLARFSDFKFHLNDRCHIIGIVCLNVEILLTLTCVCVVNDEARGMRSGIREKELIETISFLEYQKSRLKQREI